MLYNTKDTISFLIAQLGISARCTARDGPRLNVPRGTWVTDAQVAASAVHSGAALMTANGRHYKCVPDITLEHYRP